MAKLSAETYWRAVVDHWKACYAATTPRRVVPRHMPHPDHCWLDQSLGLGRDR